MEDFKLDSFLPYRLSVAANRVSKALAERYRHRFGLSIAEWRVLAHLSQAEAVSIREIHEKVDFDKSKVSRAAARLVMQGIVAKRTNLADKRLLELSLTRKGRDIMSKLVPLARDYEAEIMAKLSEADRSSLDRVLRHLEAESKQ